MKKNGRNRKEKKKKEKKKRLSETNEVGKEKYISKGSGKVNQTNKDNK